MLKKTINLLLTENQQKIIFRLWKISSHHIYIGVFASFCLMVLSGISIFFPISIGKLILDEATSALDSESEFEFQKELNALKGSMTIITVAHRLSTIKNSDKIVVLNNGIIEEMGKHEELLALNGTYKKLMERQVDLNI